MQRTGRAAGIASRLDFEQEASFVRARTVAQASAQILNEVADISSHSNNVAAEIKAIEAKRSIQTEELRRLHPARQSCARSDTWIIRPRRCDSA